MQVIIAGSRGITDPRLIAVAVSASGFRVTEVVSGTCRGVDQLGEQYARTRGIPVRRFPADWARYGRAAGPKRNAQMIEHVAASGDGGLIAIWDGTSRGTRDTIECARRAGVPVYVHRVTA